MSEHKERPTIYDVAKQAGVSIGTVSRVLNGKKDVAEETRTRVHSVAKRLGFRPKLTARRVAIGVVLQEIESVHEAGYVGGLICELANHAARRGAVLEIVPLSDLERVYEHYLQGLIGIVFGSFARELRAIRDIPVLLINNMSEADRFHCVTTDHAQGARLGASYLLERGHSRIAFVQFEKDDWGAREREKGYREAFAAAGVPVAENLITYLESWSSQEGLDPVLKHDPTAVFVAGEDLSLEVTDTLTHRLGKRIPEELSLLTYEVSRISHLLCPRQTTISQPWKTLARLAIDGILDVIKSGGKKKLCSIVPNELIERSSVRPL